MAMSLPILLIIIGILLAVLNVIPALGIALILIGLVLLVLPYFRGGTRRV